MKLLRTVSEKLKRFLSSKIYQVRWINLYNTLDAFFPQFKNGNFDFDMIVKQLEITMPPEEVVIGKEIVAVCRNEGKDNKINSIQIFILGRFKKRKFSLVRVSEYFTQLYRIYRRRLPENVSVRAMPLQTEPGKVFLPVSNGTTNERIDRFTNINESH